MAERSLRATPEGIHKAKKVVKNNGWTQTEIGEQVGTTRQPIGKFFAGKPIERPTFIDICRLLGLNWEDIAEPEPVEQNQNTSIDIDALVQEVREKIKPIIQERCGTMRVLDVSQPIGLNDIYTNVNILERITGRRRKEIAELHQECNSEDFERFGLGTITEKLVPGVEAVETYSKLMILGKPGAGKTTFLKYLAILCNNGNDKGRDTVGAGLGNNSRRPQTSSQQNPSSQPSPSTDNFSTEPALFCLVPIFVTLKDFADAANKPGLLEYISQQFSDCGFVGAIHESPLQDVIKHGRALVLLDGLDEVREEDNSRVLKEIRDFSEQFRDNHFVMTCRIAAREYTFEKFTEVEVADFDDEQISTFATKWFKNKAVKAETFIKRLEDNDRIKQLAASPLLLTLLCLAFEESGDFPANRSELYKEGLDALLKKWDAKRGIYRDQVYKKLSVQRKEDLLSKIALTTFERSDYFFKQKAAEQYITDYIRNLPAANTDEEALQLDSEEVLRAIEHHHGLMVERAKGIYSFSHLTFHEYFTAREIVFRTQPLEEALQSLVRHITERRWREVFLLAVGMLQPSADCLLQLMKQQVDVLVSGDKKLQKFLIWLNQKSGSLKVPYKPTVVRNLYLFLAFVFALDSKLVHVLINTSNSVHDYVLDRLLVQTLIPALNLELDLTFVFALSNIDYALDIDPKLKQALQQLKNQLPTPYEDIKGFQQWWIANGQAWSAKLRMLMINYRNIGQDWQFSTKQKELLQQYYDGNKFLVECLNSDCYVSREVRQEIEDTLLLPIAEIEQRKHG